MASSFVERVRQQLVNAAREGQRRSYGEICTAIGLDGRYRPHRDCVIQALKAIMREDHRAGRPYASVAAVRLDTNEPGFGFAELAWELGRFGPHDDYHQFVAWEWNRFRAVCTKHVSVMAA